ncbi:MAG: YCF48-related protein [Chitinophagaceae bacterium]|nr:YCF48-related protein [Chitinophagaceae bacterium]
MRKLTIILLLAFLGNTSIYSCKKPKKSQPPQPPGWKEVNLNYNSPLTKVKTAGNDTFYVLSSVDHVNDYTKTVIFYSYDKGNTWKSASFPRPSEGGIGNIFPVNKSKLYGTALGFFKSEASLANWQLINNIRGIKEGIFFDEKTGIVIQPDIILKTYDGGITFQVKFTAPYAGYFRDIIFPSNNTGYISAGETHDFTNVGFLCKTTDGGESWKIIKNDVGDIISMSFINDDTGYIFNSKKEIYKTSDGGNSWQLILLSCPIPPVFVHFLDHDNGYMAGLEFIYKTTDGGVSWIKEFEIAGGNFEDMSFNKDGIGVAVSGNGRLVLLK